MAVPSTHWFASREDYEEIRRISVDGESMLDYDAFVSKLERLIQETEKHGTLTTKVNIEPAGLLAWCRANNREVDTYARITYAISLFSETNE